MTPLTVASAKIHSALAASRRIRTMRKDAAQDQGAGLSENFVFSPLSIILVVMLLMRGAGNSTLEELYKFIPVDVLPSFSKVLIGTEGSGRDPFQGRFARENTEVHLVNRLYVDKRLKGKKQFKLYVHALQQEVGEDDVDTVDCEDSVTTTALINDFVRKATQGYITNVVKPGIVNKYTRLLVVSAAFLKSPWYTPFDEGLTERGEFNAVLGGGQENLTHAEVNAVEEGLAGGVTKNIVLTSQTVDIMHVMLELPARFYLKVDECVTAVGIPYQDPKYTMFVVQPNNPAMLDVLLMSEAERKSRSIRDNCVPFLDDLIASMRFNAKDLLEVKAHVSLPKFKLPGERNHIDLVPVFQEFLAIKTPFDRAKADFSGISGDHTLFISSFLHEAAIEVDERGTVASSATVASVAVMTALNFKREIRVRINKPFVFQVRFKKLPSAYQMGPTALADTESQYEELVLFSGVITDALAAQR